MLLILHALLLASTVTLIDIFAALLVGFLLSRTDLGFKRLWIGLFTIIFLLPPYVWALGWINLALNLNGFLACAAILSFSFFPLALWIVILALVKINPSSEEAGLLLGGWPKVLLNVTLPSALPSITLASFLVFILTVSESGVPSLFHFNTLSLEIFTQYSAFSNLSAALKLCLPLVPLVVLAYWLESNLLKEKAFNFLRMNQPPLTLPLGSWRGPLTLLLGFAALIPAISMTLPIFKESSSWKNFAAVAGSAGSSLGFSAVYSFIAATLMTALGFCIAIGVERRNLHWAQLADRSALLLFAIPSAMSGILQIFVWKQTEIFYGSALPLIVAYIFQYIAAPARIQSVYLKQSSVSWEEAAFISGLRGWKYFSKIAWPLYRAGILTAWIVSWIFCFKDLGLTLLLYPPGNQTLTVRLFTLMPNSPIYVQSIHSLLLAGAAVLPIFAVLSFRSEEWKLQTREL